MSDPNKAKFATATAPGALSWHAIAGVAVNAFGNVGPNPTGDDMADIIFGWAKNHLGVTTNTLVTNVDFVVTKTSAWNGPSGDEVQSTTHVHIPGTADSPETDSAAIAERVAVLFTNTPQQGDFKPLSN